MHLMPSELRLSQSHRVDARRPDVPRHAEMRASRLLRPWAIPTHNGGDASGSSRMARGIGYRHRQTLGNTTKVEHRPAESRGRRSVDADGATTDGFTHRV